MGLFSKGDKERESYLVTESGLKSPLDILHDLLKATSGATITRDFKYSIFYNVVGFKGVKDGLGTSTIVANVAIALAEMGVKVCVVDTSILYPCQDMLLNTNYHDDDRSNRLDWFDMGLSKSSVLHISKLNPSISVLSFQGRTIVDMLGTQDTEELVELAFDQLASRFDIVLVDICSETSRIAVSSMQLCQKVIQVWSNAPHLLSNGNEFVTNNSICACPLDKCRYVITSKIVDDIKTDWGIIFKKLGLKHLTSIGLSLDIARILAQSRPVWGVADSSEDVAEFNNAIIDIVCHLLNISRDGKALKTIGTFTSNDVFDGKVDGTLTKRIKEAEKDFHEILSLDDKSEVLSDSSYLNTENSYISEDLSTDEEPPSEVYDSSSLSSYLDGGESGVTSEDSSSDTENSEVEQAVETEEAPRRGRIRFGRGHKQD